MPVWVLGLILLAITFVALGIWRKRKPDVEGVQRAIAAQQERLRQIHSDALMRACVRDLEILNHVFRMRVSSLKHTFSEAISVVFAHEISLQAARGELEDSTALIEGAISSGEKGDKNGSCPPDILEFLKAAHVRYDRNFVRYVVALRRARDDVLRYEQSLREEASSLTHWTKARGEYVQERAAEIIEEIESFLFCRSERVREMLTELEMRPRGIEDAKVTPGVIKWRQERIEARRQLASNPRLPLSS